MDLKLVLNKMSLDPRAIQVYTDGSCYKNPGGHSGCAAIVSYPDHLGLGEEQIVDFGCTESSNNRMELLACIRALEWIRSNSPWAGVARVQIVTDSQYVHKNLNHALTWQRNRWRSIHGEPKANVDLWRRLLYLRAKVGVTVHFEWTLGKKSPILKAVDKAAKGAAKRVRLNSDRGFRPGVVARSMVKGAAVRFPAKGQSLVIRPYRKSLAAKGEERVRFDTFSEESQSFTASCYAYANPLIARELHRHHGYRVRFNEKPQYPQILEILEEVELPV